VDLFFVISGFLITKILYQNNNQSFSSAYFNFIGRRTLRIFPIYYLTIAVLYLANNEIVHHYLIYFLTYTYNYAWVKFKIPISEVHPFWSLCVEEQFYLFWPFVVLSLRKKSRILLGVIVIIVLTGFLQKTLNIFPSLADYNGAGLLTRMASLGLGAFGAVYSIRYKLSDKIFASKWVEFFILLIILPISLIFYFKLNVVLLAFVSLFLVLKAAYFQFYIPKLDKLLQHKKVLYIGAISYGIYVYHEPLIYYFDIYIFSPVWNSINFGFFPLLKWQSWIFKGPIYLLITVVIASLSYRYFERPILSLKNKWFKYKVTTGEN
jgi:peptidoglycan/LPS O-acetylase OafA/YrhL